MSHLDSIVNECLKGGNGYWRAAFNDGVGPLLFVGNDRFLYLIAYWHHCPQCQKTTPEMLGDMMHCACGKVSSGSYRRVGIKFPSEQELQKERPSLSESLWLKRLGTVLRNLAGTHPAEFPEEGATIALDWSEP